MFPEYREKITRLKAEDPHFAKLFHSHNDLDQEIKNMEAGITPASHDTIETLKKQKLQLKDDLYEILRKKDGCCQCGSGGCGG
ncbi:YdcH family protein [Enterobacterales bacterium AE_CKDN230030158-1A_HGKHYDSX7]